MSCSTQQDCAHLAEQQQMKHVHVTGCLQAHQFVGQQDPTQEPLHFVLHASGSESCKEHSIPFLPTGNLVSGQPAAIVSYCQVGTCC